MMNRLHTKKFYGKIGGRVGLGTKNRCGRKATNKCSEHTNGDGTSTPSISENNKKPIRMLEILKNYRSSEINLRITEVVSQRLQPVSRKIVLIPQDMIMSWAASTLQYHKIWKLTTESFIHDYHIFIEYLSYYLYAGMATEIEIKLGRVAYL